MELNHTEAAALSGSAIMLLLHVSTMNPIVIYISWKNCKKHVYESVCATLLPDLIFSLYLCPGVMVTSLGHHWWRWSPPANQCLVLSYVTLYLLGVVLLSRATVAAVRYRNWILINSTKLANGEIPPATRVWWKVAIYGLPWLLSLLPLLPKVLVINPVANTTGVNYMLPSRADFGYDISSTVFLLVVPVVTFLTCYSRIVFTYKRWANSRGRLQRSKQHRNHIQMRFAETFAYSGLMTVSGGLLMLISGSSSDSAAVSIMMSAGMFCLLSTASVYLLLSKALQIALWSHIGTKQSKSNARPRSALSQPDFDLIRDPRDTHRKLPGLPSHPRSANSGSTGFTLGPSEPTQHAHLSAGRRVSHCGRNARIEENGDECSLN
ncbi:hypothetical protein CAPTEDRAFT_196708 [Capitella teleta]|uniref:G-protein coupled receptors family 1 profile domain-containing protein n=1 Tax=Capitella teleta TaxID=283909 RepID=R7TXS2_CAPTE|nr:hypothetical protein CAPTEDRAFT_196708 [Capitella teleta]|eukprot:ELT98397.1 hypothetical protein CAPTEDRAFT_196708 [Capitella teleta]